ncbi:hypothetical protein [Streptomyces chryseus]|uniref:Uncharacterized protein n=1 Tax=Streptomyces chryseus TaxID=68186 RepID=A0ABQ3DEC6_9ACTN|nr:hypothetical protein [Streptomyces chryseus]GHA83220.1 hypothetical protein GCM10010346_01940 [Streptomyces chryseus]
MTDLTAHVQELAAYHHPHFQAVAPAEYGELRFTFKPFSGAEEEPQMPRTVWDDNTLSTEARELLDVEFRTARRAWMDAAYVHQLKAAAKDAAPAWTAYAEARDAMNRLWNDLETTPSTMWKAAVSRLVAAQEATAKAAKVWDEYAPDIAQVHRRFLHSRLYPSGAYAEAGIPAAQWVIGDVEDYQSYRGTPLVREVTETVTDQRKHLREVAALTGDPQD